MSRYYDPYPSYVSVAQRRINAQKELKKLQKRGHVIDPLGELSHRLKIATSFWGSAWCKHLESFSDYSNRLPRGRTYVRNGSILPLAITPGRVEALVQGSSLYEQTITISALPTATWKTLQAHSQGKIGSLIELLQGKISDEIMAVVTHQNDGLFPKPKEIKLSCSCPDHAGLCKHLAAVLYGIGARLDSRPELLFKLRDVDHTRLISIVDPATILGSPGKLPAAAAPWTPPLLAKFSVSIWKRTLLLQFPSLDRSLRPRSRKLARSKPAPPLSVSSAPAST